MIGGEATLRNLIAALRAQDPRRVCPDGFANPHSYRGYYEDLAFEPAKDVTVASMLAAAESALGKTFQGYKGGDYTMHEYTIVWLAPHGECGENLGPMILRFMLERGAVPPDLTGVPGHRDVLAAEIRLYNELMADTSKLAAHLPLLEGRFILIHASAVVGFYGSREEAYTDGLEKLGNVPMLIQEIRFGAEL